MRPFHIIASLLFVCFQFTGYSQVDSAAITEEKTFEKVETEATYPGGDMAWRQYLQKNLNADTPVKNSSPSGYFTVWVQFIVNKDGSITDALALTKFGYGMEAEVLRIIRGSGKWTPAYQGGRAVKAYRKQPVTFVVMDEGFEIKTRQPYTLFLNTDNEIWIDVDRVKNEDLHLTIQNGKIIRGEDGKFIARLNKSGRTIIEIYNMKKDKKVGAASFEVIAPGEKAGAIPKIQ